MRVQGFLGKKTAAIACVAVLAFTLSGCFANTSSAPPSDPLTNELFQQLNADRQANGLPPLTWSPKLANAAGTWAWNMASANSLYHQNLTALIYSPPFTGYGTLGENILVGPGSMTAASMEGAWRASPPHWANITSTNFNIVGIGYVRGPDGRIWAVQDFGGV
jgi:uncharacterized protein YkwD